MRNTAFLVVAGLLFVVLAGLAGYFLLRLRRRSKATWTGLMERLVTVNRENIALVARDLLNEQGSLNQSVEVELDPSNIWELVGGMEGLEALEKNCDVLIDMACYVQQWHPEAVVIAEQLRLNAREIKWHIDRLRGAVNTGNLRASFPDYAQRAVASYYLMTRHLLALYESSGMPTLYELQRAI